LPITKVRLAGRGATADKGRVEVLVGGEWGTVCKDGFDWEAAQVVCRMLNKSGGALASGFGPGTGPILVDNVKCSGLEQSLNNCTFNHLHDCTHDEDAAVTCTGPPPGQCALHRPHVALEYTGCTYVRISRSPVHHSNPCNESGHAAMYMCYDTARA